MIDRMASSQPASPLSWTLMTAAIAVIIHACLCLGAIEGKLHPPSQKLSISGAGVATPSPAPVYGSGSLADLNTPASPAPTPPSQTPDPAPSSVVLPSRNASRPTPTPQQWVELGAEFNRIRRPDKEDRYGLSLTEMLWPRARYPATVHIIDSDGPAYRAGLRNGDQIEQWGGTRTRDMSDSSIAGLQQLHVGTTVVVSFFRWDEATYVTTEFNKKAEMSFRSYGIELAYDVKTFPYPVITSVYPDRSAQRDGLKRGDLLFSAKKKDSRDKNDYEFSVARELHILTALSDPADATVAYSLLPQAQEDAIQKVQMDFVKLQGQVELKIIPRITKTIHAD